MNWVQVAHISFHTFINLVMNILPSMDWAPLRTRALVMHKFLHSVIMIIHHPGILVLVTHSSLHTTINMVTNTHHSINILVTNMLHLWIRALRTWALVTHSTLHTIINLVSITLHLWLWLWALLAHFILLTILLLVSQCLWSLQAPHWS